MKHVVIIGACNAGKSTTIAAICRALNPCKIYKIDFQNETSIEEPLSVEIANGTYVIEVNNVSILVVAGAPTEQGICITEIIKCVEVILKVNIEFAIVAKRARERKSGFETLTQLQSKSKCVHVERIAYIEGTTADTIKDNFNFKERVDKLVSIIKQEL